MLRRLGSLKCFPSIPPRDRQRTSGQIRSRGVPSPRCERFLGRQPICKQDLQLYIWILIPFSAFSKTNYLIYFNNSFEVLKKKNPSFSPHSLSSTFKGSFCIITFFAHIRFFKGYLAERTLLLPAWFSTTFFCGLPHTFRAIIVQPARI